MNNHTFTHAQITRSAKIPDIVHICASELGSEVTIILTQDEFTGEIKRWLRGLPMETRQEIIDELVACTLRTLEVNE